MNIIQEKWKETKLFLSSGFVFENGDVFLFDIINLKLDEECIATKKRKIGKFSIHWGDVFIQEKLQIPNCDNKIIVGSGGLGSDGFIVLVSNKNELIWSIFSESTNGFINIKYQENTVLVESGSGYNYIIPLDEPLKLKRLKNRSPFNSNGERTTYPPYLM